MRHFPIYRDLRGHRVIVSGGGEAALAKLRLILKTEARIVVFAADPAPEVRRLAAEGCLTLVERPIAPGDATCAALLYGANADAAEDARAAAIGRMAGVLVNIVDDLEASDFITPAIVDRDPVVVAIGTEGAAPVLARAIKAETEASLSPDVGTLAAIGAAFRPQVAALSSAERRQLWARFYETDGPRALREGGEAAALAALEALAAESVGALDRPGRVAFVGAGPGDPELLTLKARRRLDTADVIVHDRLVDPRILELARREAVFVEVGKVPGGPSWKQADIDRLVVQHAATGAAVVRLKSGDPGVFGRLDEEIESVAAAGIAFEIVPGITAASAAAASIGVSLTRRGRNKALRILTGHDVDGFAEHDWRTLAAPGAVAAIYMGLSAARFLQGRLMLHGAAPDTPVTAVENASRPDEKVVATTLANLPAALAEAGVKGPAILFLGLRPFAALLALAVTDTDTDTDAAAASEQARAHEPLLAAGGAS